ncbi:DUF6431 domain-containing protein, partial [Desulfosporosinus acididurans]
MSSLKTLKLEFFVRCTESVPCPCCGEQLSVIGSRMRKVKNSNAQPRVLIIRRMRCVNCRRIHHELPDCLVPYKRYESACIESVVSDRPGLSDVAADNSTLYRLRFWFAAIYPYFLNCLNTIAIRLAQGRVKEPSVPTLSVHQKIGCYVEPTPGWLARIVRPIVNANLWI